MRIESQAFIRVFSEGVRMVNLPDFDLTGRKALVTGGGDGLGIEFTEALLDAGASVVISSRRKDFIDSVVKERSKKYPLLSAIACDVTDLKDVNRLVKEIGDIDILVNSAGLSHRQPWAEEQSEDWRRIMVLNLESPHWLAQKFMPGMMERGWGRIVNISSICGIQVGDPRLLPGLGNDMPSYYASKHALLGLTKFLAATGGEHGVTVNAICPGPFFSPANSIAFGPGPILDAVSGAIPMRRIGQPGELRTALLFLTSPASSFVTGQAIVVDGGTTIW
ncbi:MAG: SDR family oxidoreductase [Actinomycetales bacterium]|nr:MAG: SDR family oxidoreductase [Actinomycetales bacterium]